MSQVPISCYEETNGVLYFPRMLDKIRKMRAGELREDFHEHLGIGLDGRLCDYLRVTYEDVQAKVAEGMRDEAILQWCYEKGRELNANDLVIWNAFVRKIGWRDQASESLIKRKADAGLQDRDDIVTMGEFMEVDEGRKP